jgi:hypothetical protein
VVALVRAEEVLHQPTRLVMDRLIPVEVLAEAMQTFMPVLVVLVLSSSNTPIQHLYLSQ